MHKAPQAHRVDVCGYRKKYGVNKTTEMIWRNILRTQQLATISVIKSTLQGVRND